MRKIIYIQNDFATNQLSPERLWELVRPIKGDRLIIGQTPGVYSGLLSSLQSKSENLPQSSQRVIDFPREPYGGKLVDPL